MEESMLSLIETIWRRSFLVMTFETIKSSQLYFLKNSWYVYIINLIAKFIIPFSFSSHVLSTGTIQLFLFYRAVYVWQYLFDFHFQYCAFCCYWKHNPPLPFLSFSVTIKLPTKLMVKVSITIYQTVYQAVSH